MGHCDHSSWLRLVSDGQIRVDVSDRLARLADQLEKEVASSPSFIILLGGESKEPILRKLGVAGGVSYQRVDSGETRLFAATTAGSPLLIADSDTVPRRRLPRTSRIFKCHETISYSIAVKTRPQRPVDFSDHLFHRVLFPFADVVCVSVAGHQALPNVIGRIVTWLDKGPASTSDIRPSLVLFMAEGNCDGVLAAFYKVLRRSNHWKIKSRFASVRVVGRANNRRKTRSTQADDQCPTNHLRDEILKCSERSHNARLPAGMLFSVHHLSALLQLAIKHLRDPFWQVFDFIQASRVNRPVAPNLEDHVENFMSQFKTLNSLKNVAIPTVASSLLLDHYPPGMHLFNPQDTFRSLYKAACYRALHCRALLRRHSAHAYALTQVPFMIEQEMIRQFGTMRELGASVTLHRRVLSSFAEAWVGIYSDHTCLSCVRRRPEYGLPCGHMLCENCLVVFGRRAIDDPFLYHMIVCILCGEDTCNLRIRVKPRTAGVNVLSIDGGGARGRFPLEFMKILEEKLDLDRPVQQHFDVVYGTSSGAIIASALYCNGWDVQHCIAIFEEVAQKIFRSPWWYSRIGFRIPFVSDIINLLLSFIIDSRYSTRSLEEVLQKTFGEKAMIDCTETSEKGVKVGIPVTTVEDGRAWIFTSYNGVGERQDGFDYRVIETDRGFSRIPLWEIIRSSTAAPYYFQPRHIDGVGTFQDGGLAFNNPASIALRESTALFPETPASLVVSLGTGYGRDQQHSASSPRSWWRSTFPVRLFRAFWQHTSSKQAWHQLLSHRDLARTSAAFRFDVEFPKMVPPLDEACGMAEMARLARESALASSAMDELKRAIRAQLLYLELDTTWPVRFHRGNYQCSGQIYCRLSRHMPKSHKYISQLIEQKYTLAIAGQTLEHGLTQRASKSRSSDVFPLRVQFQVSSRADVFPITLQEEGQEPCHISGSPFTVDWLVRRQDLEAHFGASDHRKRTATSEALQSGNIKRQRLR